MLLLSCSSYGGTSYRLTENKLHYVSRTDGDIILTGDQSVSRKHAVLNVISKHEGGDGSEVTVTDLGSKYGTFINETTKLDPNMPHVLKDGDVIKFGCQWNNWRFDSKPLVVTTSTLPAEVKVSLTNLISELGGTLINDWQETCSHLTMTSILLTAKVVCALASAVPIVTPEYWTCFKEAIEQNKFPPGPEKFIPPLKEKILNKNKVSFAVNEERRKVFTKKTFVFCNEKQMKKYKSLISAAGGKYVNFGDCNWEIEEFCKPDIIVMQNLFDETQQTQSMDKYNSVLNLLKSKGSRAIPESEVGLAILMCSLDIYCNPKYDVNVLLGGAEVSLTQLRTQDVLAADTQSVVDESTVKIEKTLEDKPIIKNELIVESGSSSCHDSGSNSDKFCDMETLPFEELVQNKNSKCGPTIEKDELGSGITTSRKRMPSDDSEMPQPKKVLTEKNPLESASQLDVFNFTDLCGSRSSRRSRAANEKKDDFVGGTKRKCVDNGIAFADEQPKKICLEETLNSKQCNAGRSNDSITTVNSEMNYANQEERIVISKAGTSKNIECSSKEFSEGKSCFEKETIDRDYKENGVSSAIAIPSKAGSSDDFVTMAEKKSGKWNRGMTAGILDMIVKTENLIVSRPIPQVSQSNHSVNFKRFRKVRPSTFQNSLPEIIGDNDLFAC